MPDSPLCPGCGREMSLKRTLPRDVDETVDVNVFRCPICDVAFITKDHTPVAGVRVRG